MFIEAIEPNTKIKVVFVIRNKKCKQLKSTLRLYVVRL